MELSKVVIASNARGSDDHQQASHIGRGQGDFHVGRLGGVSGIHSRFGIPPLTSNSIGGVGPRAPALTADNETAALAVPMARAATAKWSGTYGQERARFRATHRERLARPPISVLGPNSHAGSNTHFA